MKCEFIDFSIVTYNSAQWLDRFFESLINQAFSCKKINLFIRDNDSIDETVVILKSLIKKYHDVFHYIELSVGKNIGFGSGHNDNLKKATSAFFLVSNVDLTFELESIAIIVDTALHDDPNVASWEFRQKPYEHPKFYHPVTLITTWSSSACILFRRSALEKIGGYEEKIFLYGEDVELSYRLRDHGFILKYCPAAVCWHYSYAYAHEIKPPQFFGSAFANLFIRFRYGSFTQIIYGFFIYFKHFLMMVNIKNKNTNLIINLFKIIGLLPFFLKTRKKTNKHFPLRNGDYEIRRKGAFFKHSALNKNAPIPLVSVITRTYQGRLGWLKEAITSVLNQTYPHIELVVIEDGSETAKELLESLKEQSKLSHLIYHSIPKAGRSVAGNVGLSLARGDFFVFLDDDDLFFADHIEILSDALSKNKEMGATFSFAYCIPTEVITTEPLQYRIRAYQHIYMRPFSRSALRTENYLPIQTVLFRRTLYEKNGGFDVTLNYLEDWDLWIRYSLKDDFMLIEKTTSLYRVPGDIKMAMRRHQLLDRWREKVIHKHKNDYLSMAHSVDINEYLYFTRSSRFVVVIKRLCVKLPTPIYFLSKWIYRKIKKDKSVFQ